MVISSNVARSRHLIRDEGMLCLCGGGAEIDDGGTRMGLKYGLDHRDRQGKEG